MPERRTGHNVLARIAGTPHLARAVPRLPPELLHAVILHQGLEDCGELLALATAQQLSAVLDIDLWKAGRDGRREQLDDARFREWIDVLVDTGPPLAADRLARMDPALVVAGLSPAIRVFDAAAFPRDRVADTEIGGYAILARHSDNRGPVMDALRALAEHHPAAFHRVMRGCRTLSDSGRELDGCDDLMSEADQARFDLAAARERRRERRGFLSPQQAHAFLHGARQTSLTGNRPGPDAIFAAYRRSLDEMDGADAAGNDGTMAADAGGEPQEDCAPAVALLLDELRDAGILTDAPRALLMAPEGDGSALTPAFSAYLERCIGRDELVWMSRAQELAFLTNAMAAGCSVQCRSLTTKEASDAVAATCNLGLEYWPRVWGDPAEHDLLAIFRVGWTVLYREVSVPASRRLVDSVDAITSSDRDLQMGLYALGRELRKQLRLGTPWRARSALDVLALLDLPTWAAMLALMDECPVMLANVRPQTGRPVHTLSPSEFRLIATAADVASLRAFLNALTERLTE